MSILSIVASVAAVHTLGFVWYDVFAGPWLRGLGKKRGDFDGSDKTPYMFNIVSAVAISTFMSCTLSPFFGVVTLEEAIHFSLRVSVVSALLQMSHHAFEGRGWSTYAVNVGFDVIYFLIVCVCTTLL